MFGSAPIYGVMPGIRRKYPKRVKIAENILGYARNPFLLHYYVSFVPSSVVITSLGGALVAAYLCGHIMWYHDLLLFFLAPKEGCDLWLWHSLVAFHYLLIKIIFTREQFQFKRFVRSSEYIWKSSLTNYYKNIFHILFSGILNLTIQIQCFVLHI